MTAQITTTPDTGLVRRRLIIRGLVQGVGFRPFVARLAQGMGLSGSCGNDEMSVFIEVEGPVGQLDEFSLRLRREAPAMAIVVEVVVEETSPLGDEGFQIVPSRAAAGTRTLVPPDVATCADCLRELSDPGDRRYRHPFITCTNCGPRFTIINDLPYDRVATTMAAFPMCPRCQEEYDDPGDRRFHAQPVSCHGCGPRLWWEAGDRTVIGHDQAIAEAQRALADGGIIAIKGIGGFHLACDATNSGAVARLRARKHRPDKPFALMVPDLDAVRRIAAVSPGEAELLSCPARPIVLLTARPASPVAEGVAPGLDELAVMLPYAPLHHLLLSAQPDSGQLPPQLLVMTSGNLSDEPLCFDNEDARVRLGRIADAFLMHDRPIAVPCEDSVVTLVEGRESPVRRSRGFAPLPVRLPGIGPSVLAVGGEVKNAFCVTRDDLAFCSAHLGDMGSLESQQAFVSSVGHLTALHAVEPQAVVADRHPGYATTRWAEQWAERTQQPLVSAQHHHAHVASLLAEHGRVGQVVLGVAFDGTGFGCDQQVWGGEVLHVGADVSEFQRVGHLELFGLAGGDAAVRNPFRVALALLQAAGLDDGGWAPAGIPAGELAVVRGQLGSGAGCVQTSSVGRLFDGVASLLEVRHRVTYEAQAAIELEALARSATRPVRLEMSADAGVLHLSELVAGLVQGRRRGAAPADLAAGFHDALARATAKLVIALAAERGVGTIGLTGGVFQNRLLHVGLAQLLRAAGLEVLTHRQVPANDGGLALGQAVIGRAALARPQQEGGA